MNENTEVRDVFLAALALSSAEQQSRYLDQACRAKPELRQRVEQLLREHQHAGSFLEEPALPSPKPTLVLSATLTEKPGDRIARYKLLQQIGEGGCGVVYMAEQEEPIHRRVALKVIKVGMDTRQVIARFEAERQALALMDHPNIAKVLDAGATETGRPYFVMELVRGIKITEYCDQNNLTTEERLDLFVQICHAVQHAHQKGILHRDIKPSNILVTLHDGKPLPKIIDFGIAKATTGQLLTDKTLFTAFEQFIGTPAYMSPEQAEMSTLDIDTRSDIYALGVLLYELLTGRTPFDQKELVAAGLSEMRRIIREEEPLRPSTRISTLEATAQTALARRRNSEPPQLIHLVRGDLDWIVMKCLEKDRTRRYETANALADDVVRHMQDEPVVARPPGRVYRLQKLMRRNKAVFAGATAVVAALVIGLGLSTWLFWKEREARQQAVAAEKETKTEAKRSQQVAQFLQDMLKGVGPSVAMGRDTTMLQEILDKTAERVGKDLHDSPEVEAELRTTLGEVYLQLGQITRAEEMHRAALVIRRGIWGNMNTNVAESLENLATVLEWQWKPAEAEPLVLEALTIRTNLLGAEHPKVAESLATLGDVRSDQGRFIEAEELYRHALAMRRKLLGNDSLEAVRSLTQLSELFLTHSRPQEAETAAREAVAIQKRLLGEERPDPHLWEPQVVLGQVLLWEGKLDEAESTLRPVLAMRRKLLGSESTLVASPSELLVSVLHRQGKQDEAEQLGREVLAALKVSSNPGDAFNTVFCMADLTEILYEKGKLAEAEALFREAVKTARKAPASDWQIRTLARLGDLIRDQGKPAEAEPLHREGLDIFRQNAPNNFSLHQWLASGLALDLSKQGKPTEAEALFRESVEAGRKLPPSSDLARTLAGYGDTLRDEGKLTEAESLYREGLDLCRRLATNDFELRQWLTVGLTSILRSQSKLVEAAALYRETLEVGRKLPPSSDLAAVLAGYADILRDQGSLAEAEPMYREGLDLCRRLDPNNALRRQWLAGNLALLLQSQGKFAEAEPLYREAVTNSMQLWPNDPTRWYWQAGNLGLVLQNQGKLAEAEPFYREAVTNAAKVWPNDFNKWGWEFTNLVDVLQLQGKTNEARQVRQAYQPAAVQTRMPTAISTNEAAALKTAP